MILIRQWWFSGTVVWLMMMTSLGSLYIAAKGADLQIIMTLNALLILSGTYLTAYSTAVRTRENTAREEVK